MDEMDGAAEDKLKPPATLPLPHTHAHIHTILHVQTLISSAQLLIVDRAETDSFKVGKQFRVYQVK